MSLSNIDNGPLYQNANGGLVTQPAATLSLKQRAYSGYLESTSSIPSTLLQSSSQDVTWYLNEISSNVSTLDSMYLSITVQNNDGVNALWLASGFEMVEFIQIQSSGVVIQEIRPILARMLYLTSHTDEQMRSILPIIGIDGSTFQSNVVINPAGQFNYLLPIQSFIDVCKIPLWKQLNLSVLIRFSAQAKFLRAGSPAGIASASVVGSTRILYQGHKLSDATLAARDRNLAGQKISVRFVDHLFMQQGASNLTQGTQTSVNSMIQGRCLGYLLNVQSSTPVGAELYTSIPLQDYDLVRSGLSLQSNFGIGSYTELWSKAVASRDFVNTGLIEAIPTHTFSWSDDLIKDTETCSSHGYTKLFGLNEQIVFTPDQNLANSMVSVYAMLWSYCCIQFDTKTISVYRYYND